MIQGPSKRNQGKSSKHGGLLVCNHCYEGILAVKLRRISETSLTKPRPIQAPYEKKAATASRRPVSRSPSCARALVTFATS